MSTLQPARESNIQAIVSYFKDGIKSPGRPQRLGVELEHIVVHNDMQPLSYSDEFGVRWILEQLNAQYPDRTIDNTGQLIGVSGGNKAITIEPAGQLELSAGPYEDVGEIRYDFETFQRDLSELLEPRGLRALAVGYHPTAKAVDLELIPKQRYQIMDKHFEGIGRFGRCMMRGSAATQISIDYQSEQDCLRKMRLASACAPLFAMLCDNAPIFEGEPRTHHMVRTEIWRYCDPARCNLVPGVMNPDFSLEAYARYILDAPAVVQRLENGTLKATELTFGELFADNAMSHDQLEYALSMFFNDVRLKTYIEIRPADSMPIPFVTAYAALIKGLFYDEGNLDEMEALFAGVTESDVEQAKTNLMQEGFDAHVYGREAGELTDQLISYAHDALASNERSYLSPIAQLSKMRKTLAMMGERSA